MEAHIQVLYTGPASKFSWIVPVTSVPTVSVGADILFDRIEPPTRPSFNVTYQQEGNCRGVSGVGAGCGSAAGGVSASANGDGTKGDHGQPEVDVLSHGSVGPYDYVVIKSEDGGTLRSWLTDHGYYVSEDAARIIDEYVAGQFSFVAVRLQGGQDVSAIRPIVLRMTAPEACLPLKLTAIGIVLEHVAGRPSQQRLAHQLLALVHGEDAHPGPRQLAPGLPRRLHPVQLGQRQGEHRHVRARRQRQRHRLAPVGGLGDDRQPGRASSSARSPRRTTSWSSASRIRISPPSLHRPGWSR